MFIKDFSLSVGNFRNVPCTAPTSMYRALYDNRLIPDPFYGLNELDLTALSEEDATFASTFTVDEETFAREHIELTFYGLDTICDIYLNGKRLDSVANMHRTYTYDVKERLVLGENTLRLDFSSPLPYFRKMNDKHFIFMNGDTIPGACHLRKALYMSGWDWGPTLPDMGIFRDIVLRAYDCDRIEDTEIRQEHKKSGVRVSFNATAKHGAEGCKIYAEMNGEKVEVSESITVTEPKLWWPRGYGEQPLYDVLFTMEKDGKVIDTVKKTIGLRTITVSTGPANDYEFAFVVNGVKIFAMGANYIPQDSFPSRVSPENTEKLLRQACDANFNCVRVWGGGYYPEDFFYDSCDRLGLLVWQDFMSACMNVWLRKDFKREFCLEAVDNVKRLRHHASLALLCGNNENESAIYAWDVVKTDLNRLDHLELYEHLLADIAEEYAPETFYWPASPSTVGGFCQTDDYDKGDTHYWEVWHGGIPFTEYRKHKFRFCSEFGFESFPSMKTVRTFCDEENMNPFSRMMENHQKCKNGNRKILTYMADDYLYPSNMEDLVYASQLLQARAIKYGVEHFRRNRGYCMGSIYWQFNDCWPVASWSSVDYYGRYKALHYAARKFYAPVAMGLFLENGRLTVNVSNEQRKDFTGSIRYRFANNMGEVLYEDTKKFSLDALTSEDIAVYKPSAEKPYTTFVTVDLFDENGVFVQRQTELFTQPKYFEWQKPTIKVEAADAEGGVLLSFTADVFAKDVFVDFDGADIVLSDNYFDLTDGSAYTVLARTDLSAEELKRRMILKSVYNIGK